MASPESQTALDRVVLTSINNAASFYEEGKYQIVCAVPDCQAPGAFEVHHAVQKQRCRREGAPQHSPDDALRTCLGCHGDHTSHKRRIPMAALRDENIAFAAHWLGAGPAYEYFHSHYSGSDPRIDALLEIT